MINGVSYYYSGSTYRSVLDRFWTEMKRSAALTIAHRHKKRSVKWTKQRYGKEIKVINPKTKKEHVLFMPKVGEHRFRSGEIRSMLAQVTGNYLPITLNAIVSVKELDCCIPGCTLKAQAWHHIRHRKKIKGNDLQRKITAYTAKQVPLCHDHHVQVHSGKYDGPSIRKMPGYTPSEFDK